MAYDKALHQKLPDKGRIVWLITGVAMAAAGLYLLVLIFTPTFSVAAPSDTSQDNWSEPVPTANLQQNRIYIPRLSLVLPYESGNEDVLRNALWHRYPQRGDPARGGNFILAGHRLEVGLTPGATKRQSPLYHIDKIQVGDFIYADFNGARYQYRVTEKYGVRPHQVEIEASSELPKMTLYTCTLQGESDGREVVQATLVKQVDPADELLLN